MVSFHPHPARFNMLLTGDVPYSPDSWTEQFPRLLEPQGVVSYVAHTGREAISLAERVEIHAAVIDLATPLEPRPSPPPAATPASAWLVELLRRLPNRPPLVVIHNQAYDQRQVDRLLSEALRIGAFSVLNKPIELQQLLVVFQRLVDRAYQGSWPRPRDGPAPLH